MLVSSLITATKHRSQATLGRQGFIHSQLHLTVRHRGEVTWQEFEAASHIASTARAGSDELVPACLFTVSIFIQSWTSFLGNGLTHFRAGSSTAVNAVQPVFSGMPGSLSPVAAGSDHHITLRRPHTAHPDAMLSRTTSGG